MSSHWRKGSWKYLQYEPTQGAEHLYTQYTKLGWGHVLGKNQNPGN